MLKLIVADNLKSGITQPCYSEPTLHSAYQRFATHYGITVLPAHVRCPRDKAKGENAVQIVERSIMATLRHNVPCSHAEIVHAIALHSMLWRIKGQL